MSITPPPWLLATQSQEHLSQVLNDLAEREDLRRQARDASRRGITTGSSSTSPTTNVRAILHIPKAPPVKQSALDHYSVTEGSKAHNMPRNRYYRLEAYDRTRVIVDEMTTGPTVNSGRYINANWVMELAGKKWWIATQAPLPHTVHAFLTILRRPSIRPPFKVGSPFCRVRTVVQLTKNCEGGRIKAHAYFPSTFGKSLIVPPDEGCTLPALKVTLLQSVEIPEARCVRSTVAVSPIQHWPLKAADAHTGLKECDDNELDYDEGKDERVIFQHLLYTSWPDHGVPDPDDRVSLLKFIKLVDEANRDVTFCTENKALLDSNPPVMVGCSAGIGRTGSFIAQCSLLRSIGYLMPASGSSTSVTSESEGHVSIEAALPPSPLGPLPQSIREDPVAREVDSLREQRHGMVERDDQIQLIYQILLDAIHIPSP